jgi:hypothetical protein
MTISTPAQTLAPTGGRYSAALGNERQGRRPMMRREAFLTGSLLAIQLILLPQLLLI